MQSSRIFRVRPPLSCSCRLPKRSPRPEGRAHLLLPPVLYALGLLELPFDNVELAFLLLEVYHPPVPVNLPGASRVRWEKMHPSVSQGLMISDGTSLIIQATVGAETIIIAPSAVAVPNPFVQRRNPRRGDTRMEALLFGKRSMSLHFSRGCRGAGG